MLLAQRSSSQSPGSISWPKTSFRRLGTPGRVIWLQQQSWRRSRGGCCLRRRWGGTSAWQSEKSLNSQPWLTLVVNGVTSKRTRRREMLTSALSVFRTCVKNWVLEITTSRVLVSAFDTILVCPLPNMSKVQQNVSFSRKLKLSLSVGNSEERDNYAVFWRYLEISG